MTDNKDKEVEQATKAAKIFAARTHTDWQEWLGQSWELIHRGYSISSVILSLRAIYQKEKEGGITYIPERLYMRQKPYDDSS